MIRYPIKTFAVILFGLANFSLLAAHEEPATKSITVFSTLSHAPNSYPAIKRTYRIPESHFQQLAKCPDISKIICKHSWVLVNEEFLFHEASDINCTTYAIPSPDSLKRTVPIIEDKPKNVKKIAKGNNSVVYQGMMLDDKPCTLRIYDLTEEHAKSFFDARIFNINYQMSFDATLLIEKFYGYYRELDIEGESYTIVTEHFSHRSLDKFRNTDDGKKQLANKKMVLRNLLGLSKTLTTAHEKYQVAHYNINPTSILVADDGTWKFTQFGMHRQYGETPHSGTGNNKMRPFYPAEMQGTEQYAHISDAGENGSHRLSLLKEYMAVDVYSFATLTALLLLDDNDARLKLWNRVSQSAPVFSPRVGKGMHIFNILGAFPDEPKNSSYSYDKIIKGLPAEFVDGMLPFLDKDPKKRGSARELALLLEKMSEQ